MHHIRGPRAQLRTQRAASTQSLDEMPAQRAEVQPAVRQALDRPGRRRARELPHRREAGEAGFEPGREREPDPQRLLELALPHHAGAEVALVEEQNPHSVGAERC